MKKYISILFIFCQLWAFAQKERHTISGFIKDHASGELMIGVSIAFPKFKTGTTTNAYGFYSITLPQDTFDMIVTYVGYAPKAYRVVLVNDQSINIHLKESGQLDEIVVSGQKNYTRIADNTRMSMIEIPIQQIRDIPALFGEKDVLKVIQLLPGVQKGGEGNSGIYVRGGGPDQNLIILDDATVYNAFHLFGFFSLFNGDALKNIEFTKGGFPARYGGRLSSVIDMSMKEGNKYEYKGEAGIGLISSRLVFEGPIKKGKSSFLVSARRTYVDILMKPFLTNEVDVGYYFYDLNAKANYEWNDRNRIYISGYFGRDKFYFDSEAGSNNSFESAITWGNATGTVRWNHLYNKKLFSNTSFIVSDYTFALTQNFKLDSFVYQQRYSSGILDLSIKHDFDYRPSKNHTVKFGLLATRHLFTPQAIVVKDNFTGENSNNRFDIPSYENAVYAEDDWTISAKWKANLGLRLAHFHAQNKDYFFAEPRVSLLYFLKDDLSLKASYANMNQFVHLLTNTGAGLPTDLWVPSTNNIKPQSSWQTAAGISKDFLDKNFSISVEGYYKESTNIISYIEGASFLDIDPNTNKTDAFSYERNITSGKGWSYGAEFLLQRKTGRLNGWIGYTLSWTQLQFDELNNGKKFWARYDRRHDISVVAIYEWKKQEKNKNGITLSATWVYGTGNAITLPVGEFNAPIHQPGNQQGQFAPWFYGNLVSQYTERNTFRMAPYHRMDFGIQVSKKMKWWVRTWEFSVYNLYNRYNPYFYYISYEDNFFATGNRVLKQVTLFPIIPSVSWNIKF